MLPDVLHILVTVKILKFYVVNRAELIGNSVGIETLNIIFSSEYTSYHLTKRICYYKKPPKTRT